MIDYWSHITAALAHVNILYVSIFLSKTLYTEMCAAQLPECWDSWPSLCSLTQTETNHFPQCLPIPLKQLTEAGDAPVQTILKNGSWFVFTQTEKASNRF